MDQPAEMTRRERRRRIVVDERSQTRTLRKICLVPVLALLLNSVILAVLAVQLMGEAERAGTELPSIPLLFAAIGVLVVTAPALLILQAIRYSHRVAGPAYRVKRSLEQFRAGERAQRVHLRPDDEIQDVAEALNQFLEWVEGELDSGQAERSHRTESTLSVPSGP